MHTVLSIAGSDPSGGAGYAADLKTIAAHGLYGMSVVTALVAQNTTGVFGVLPTDPAFVAKQIDCVFEDIRPDAVKIGMLGSAETAEAVIDRLIAHDAQNIVLDPVMISTSGRRLLDENAVHTLVHRLLPRITLLTPNLPEAEVFCGFAIRTHDEMERAARAIPAAGVLIKGGHLDGDADDLLFADDVSHWLCAPRIANPNTHGTGCTLSSAIACELAEGRPLTDAVARAKRYLTACLQAGLALGHGNGPLQHNVNWDA